MLPPDWLEYIAKVEREGRSRPPEAPKKPGPIKKHMSARQRIAFSQQANEFKAGFQMDYNPTPIRSSQVGLTLNIGGSCEGPQEHGKDTSSRS